MVPGKKGYWTFTMDDFKVNGQSVTSTRKAIVDSGTSLLAVPTADIEKIAQLVGAKKVLPIPPFNKEYTVDCNSPGPDLDIVIGLECCETNIKQSAFICAEVESIKQTIIR